MVPAAAVGLVTIWMLGKRPLELDMCWQMLANPSQQPARVDLRGLLPRQDCTRCFCVHCWCPCRRIIAAINKAAAAKGQAAAFKADFVGGTVENGRNIYYGEGAAALQVLQHAAAAVGCMLRLYAAQSHSALNCSLRLPACVLGIARRLRTLNDHIACNMPPTLLHPAVTSLASMPASS